MRKLLTLCFLFFLFFSSAQVGVKNLRCEMLTNPMGINIAEPRLSWQITSSMRGVQQTHFEILVASSKEILAKNEGDLWKSSRQPSNMSIHIRYAGKALNSRATCFWKVKSYTNKGTSSWSLPATFSIGLLNKVDWQAQWIGYDKASPWDSISQWSRLSARYFRKQFGAEKVVKKATLYIVGLGLYEVYLNGNKIGNQVLAPAPTDYRKSVLYNTHDVTNQIRKGGNVLATVLGNGRFFTMRQDYKPKKINTFGYPKMLLQLEIEYKDGSKSMVVSDDSWKLHVDGPIRANNEYDGEEYDATKEQIGWDKTGFDDRKWIKPEMVVAPLGAVEAQMTEPMKIMKKIKPISIIKQSNGNFILDMGQNFSGWLQMKVQGSRGRKVKLRFAESLEKTGSLYVANLRDARVTDVYTLKGMGVETWSPSFVYHGFRYVEIINYPGTPSINNFEGQMVYDQLATSGTFETSDAIINKVYNNAWWGIASNYKGMPVDCPQRNERQPWLGDRATGAYGESFLFANQNLYAKWLNDIEASQTEEGAIPDVAPAFWNYYSDNVTWPGTYILVANMLYHQFGDEQSIMKHYAGMKKWMAYMKHKYMKDFILTKDKYGDWCVPPESLELIHAKDSTLNTNGALIATAYYFRLLQHMKSFAEIVKNETDVEEYSVLAAQIKIAFNHKFFNQQKKYYDNNSITANLLPLYFGIVADSLRATVFNTIYNKIKLDNHMHISTGVIGTQWLLRSLTDFNRSDIAYTIASNKTYPSWGYMTENGATTIWELWNGNTANPQMNSQNHVMLLGDLLVWFYENLAGIRSDENAVAFKKIIMKPENIDGLRFVNSSYQSVYGNIKSNWKKTIDKFSWNISIPANTSAIVYIPATSERDIFENGNAITTDPNIRFLKMEQGNAIFEMGSGNYSFVSKFNFRKGIVTDEFIFDRASFPESHAATIVETPKGLLAAWFGGTKEGNKDVCIWTSSRLNGSWTAPKKVADGVLNDSLRYACYNPVLYQIPQGDLLLFYKIGPNVAGWTGWMMRSTDHGMSWGAREALPDGFLGPIKNKPELIDGVLVCPSSTEKNGWKVHFEYTKDWGKTWQKSIDINDGTAFSAIQPSILKYKDGRLQVLCRSRNTSVNQSWSTDGGKSWEAMSATTLPNNNSGTDAVTLNDGTQLIVYNHALPDASWVKGKGPRTPLNVAVSKDGLKWFAVAVLEDSPVSQYSYPAVIQSADGLVHIVYTWRRERIKHVVIDPKKIVLQEIINGRWPSDKAVVASGFTEE